MARELIDVSDPKNFVGVVTWMVLGDGNLALSGRQKNAYLQITHKEENEDYVRMKADILAGLTKATAKRYWHSKAEKYFWQIWTGSHPVYTQIRRGTYLDGRKVISPHAVKLLNELALAILYQDDGRFNEEHCNLTINKPTFSVPEMELLAKGIVDKWGLIFRLRKSAVLKDGTQGHELALRKKDWDKFFNLVGPYVVPSMRYKVRRGGTSTEVVR